MDRDLPLDDLRAVVRALAAEGITQFAFTGGIAFSVWVEPRYTKDIDLQAIVPLESVDRLLALYDGVRSGPSPLPDLIRLQLGRFDVDIFVAHTAYQRESLSRSREVALDDLLVRVVTPEDLFLQKLTKLHSDRRRVLQDLADLRALAEAHPALDREYLARWEGEKVLRLLDGIGQLDQARLLAFLTGSED